MTQPTAHRLGLALLAVRLAVLAMAAALLLIPPMLARQAALSGPVAATSTSSVNSTKTVTSTSASAVTVPQPMGEIHWRPTARTGLVLTVLDKTWFTIGYDERRKNPAWVSYDLAGPISHPGLEPTRPASFGTDFGTMAYVSHLDYIGRPSF